MMNANLCLQTSRPARATRLAIMAWFAALAAGVLPVCAAVEGGTLTPARLTCEYAADPLGIDVARPRLCWWPESSERGQKQAAFQLFLVASSAEDLASNVAEQIGDAIVFDAGPGIYEFKAMESK
jgi:hypothetical protein